MKQKHVHIYGLKTCDTCRKALKQVDGAEFVDVRAAGLPPDVLEQALATFGDALINKRSTTWRNLSDADRLQAPEDLLKAYPAVMKRPLIAVEGSLLLGWGKDTQSALGVST